MTSEYIKATLALPKEYDTVWVRVCGRRPMKMYRIGNRFLYCNETLHKNGNYASISERVLWKYCKNQGTMTREEIKQNARKYAEPLADSLHFGDSPMTRARIHAFIKGAEYADSHPKKGLWDSEKVIEWIKNNAGSYLEDNHKFGEGSEYCTTELLDDLRKAMED